VTPAHRCRACGAAALTRVLDLGPCPLATDFPLPDAPLPDPAWPLELWMCERCLLVQLGPGSPPEPPPAAHAPARSATIERHQAAFVDRLAADGLLDGAVVSLASHGGHLDDLLAARGASVTANRAVDPAGDLVADAVSFGRARAAALRPPGGHASLVVDSYLLAHVADTEDFVAGLADLLGQDGTAVIEMDHLLPLVEGRKFDAIRHGHYAYPSLLALRGLFERHGLRIRDAEPQPVYGGTLRVRVDGRPGASASPAVGALLRRETEAGLGDVERMRAFGAAVRDLCAETLSRVASLRAAGARVAAYGAPSRGTTFVNVAGLTAADLAFTVDRDPAKQGRCIPGPRIPIEPLAALDAHRPDELLVLTWDLRDEVIDTLSGYLDAGGRLLFAIPELDVVAGRPAARPAAAHL
jgi:hypothetical protein